MTSIISLVPSITLLLFDLGLEKNIVGRTKFCIHPEDKVKQVATIGGTKIIDIEKIRLLKPDLIIANHEENEREQVEELQKEFNVIVTDVKNLEDNYKMIEQIGSLRILLKWQHRSFPKQNQIFQSWNQEFPNLQILQSTLYTSSGASRI
jgi:ABC-type Fe3+-hydroxamate transport system substrate-binding protein